MPPFQYQEFQDRHSGTIADLTARRGDVEAAGALRKGDALAGGTLRSSAALGAGLEGAANAIGGIPQDMARAKAQETAQAGADIQLQNLKRQQAELQALDQAYAQPGGREAVLEGLRKTAPHLIPEVMKTFDQLDKTHGEVTKLRDEADQRAIEGAADVGAKIHAFGDDPIAAQVVISDYKSKYAGDPVRLKQIESLQSALLANPTPETVKGMADTLIQASPARRKEAHDAAELKAKQDRDAQLKANEDKIRQDTEARDAASKVNAEELRKQGERRLGIEQQQADTAKAREARERSEHDAVFNPPKDASGKPVVSATAQLIADYKLAPPSPMRLQTPQGMALMEQVRSVNPEYDAKEFPTRSAMRKAYTSGNQSQQLTALNTAIEHLGKLDEVAKAMQNGSFQPGNELYNWVRTTFGSSAVTKFDFARDIMSGELATAMKKSGATDTEIEKVTGSLKSSSSPKQLADNIRDIALPMIAGKAGTLDQQYRAVMGAKDPFSVYTPGAKGVMDRFKEAPKTQQQAAAPSVGSVVTYQGKQYKVKSIQNGQAVLEPQ